MSAKSVNLRLLSVNLNWNHSLVILKSHQGYTLCSFVILQCSVVCREVR